MAKLSGTPVRGCAKAEPRGVQGLAREVEQGMARSVVERRRAAAGCGADRADRRPPGGPGWPGGRGSGGCARWPAAFQQRHGGLVVAEGAVAGQRGLAAARRPGPCVCARAGRARSRPRFRPRRDSARPSTARDRRGRGRGRRKRRTARASASSVLATTMTPEVSLSSRWTMPGRRSPPMPGGVAAMGEQGVDQGAVLVARRGMDDQPGRLVEHHQVGVLVENRQRDRLRQRRRRDRGRRRQAVKRAGADGFGGLGDGDAVAGRVAGLDEVLHARAGKGGDTLGEEAVDALPGGLGGSTGGVDDCAGGGFIGHAASRYSGWRGGWRGACVG